MSNPTAPIVIERPDVEIERANASLWIKRAEILKVRSDDDYVQAGSYLRFLADREREVTDKMAPLCIATDKAHKEATGLRAALLAPLKQAREIISRKLWLWEREREKARLAERARLEAEQRANAETVKIQKAEALSALGQKEAAEAELDREIVTAVTALPPPAKIDGYSSATVLDFEIVNPDAVNRRYCAPDEKKIRKIVQAMGVEAAKIVGGIRVFEKPRQTVRR